MHLSTIARAALPVAAALLIGSIAFGQTAPSPSQTAPAASQTAPGFYGKWVTKMSCPAKGNTEGYTWWLPSTVDNGNFRGERGTAGEPGYLLIEGKIAKDGTAKLSANGIVADRKYARGVLAHKGADYSYDIKAKFEETQGSGTRDVGLGIVGRPCTFDFTKK